MKKIVIIRLLLVSMLFLNSCKFLSGEAGYKYDLQNIIFRITEPKGDKKINDSVFNGYIKSKYGILSDKLIVEFIGNRSEADIHGVHGWYYHDWVRAYSIIAPFMSKPFEVWIDNRTHKVFGDNFYEVLSTDEKFQHLYSEWVKKQIGCEDENVELKFANYNTNEKLNIDFVNIKNISTNYDEIFKNLYNYYLIEIHRKNIKDLSNINYKQYADEINNKYFKKIENITGKSKIEHYVELYNNNVNLLDINYHTFGKTDYSKIDMHYEVEYE